MLAMLAPTTALAQNRRTKLKRGVVNLATGWVELPKNIYDKTVEEGPARGITLGLIGGIGMAIVRTGTGLYEVITFPWACPEEYQVILEPEFVINN